MTLGLPVLLVVTFALGALGTRAALGYARRRGVLDLPGRRSSHARPTPRGGGIAIAGAATVAAVALLAGGALPTWTGLVWLGVLAVAVVGWIDDHRPLGVGVRLAVHLAAGGWILWWIPGIPAFWPLWAALILATAWTINLYNFMDGIDGLAAAEAVFVFAAAGWMMAQPAAGLRELAWGVAAAGCGFLLYNHPPARIFMGDVGSAFLGAAAAALAVAGWAVGALAWWMWLILGAVFWVDASYTLFVRTVSGQRIWEAHRSHAYQILARRWRSHGRVTALVSFYNVFWLLPLAGWAQREPGRWPWALGLAVVPVLSACVALGAGRPERAAEAPS